MRSRLPYMPLFQSLEGKALTILREVHPANGLEAWRHSQSSKGTGNAQKVETPRKSPKQRQRINHAPFNTVFLRRVCFRLLCCRSSLFMSSSGGSCQEGRGREAMDCKARNGLSIARRRVTAAATTNTTTNNTNYQE